MSRRDATPSYGAIARAVGRSLRRKRRRGHGPLGVAIPGTDLGPRAGWKGGVVRISDLTDEERIAIGGRARSDPAYRSVIEPWICQNPCCRHWTRSTDSLTPDRCNWCGTPRYAA